MIPSAQRIDEILSMRSTDSRKGDMEALAAYISSLRSDLSSHNAPTPDYTGEGSAWVPPVEAWAVVVSRDCGSCASYQDIGGDCMKCDGCEPDEMPNWTPSRALASACAIPADSVLREALTCISLCSRNSASSKEECGKIARTALWQSKYGPERIAWELDETASGRAYYGNALRVAKDFPGITPEERGVLDAWLTGRATFDPKQNFSWPLQEIAAKLRATPADRVPGEGVVTLRRFAERCAQRDHQPDEHIGRAKCVSCEAEDALRAYQGGRDGSSG